MTDAFTTNEITTSAPGIGHNNPPSAIEELRAQLVAGNTALTARTAELEAAAERLPATIDDDAMAGRVGDFKVQISGQIKLLDSAREAAKDPYLSGGRAVDAFFNAEIARLKKSFGVLQARHTAYLGAKEDRQRAEAQRLAEEAYSRAMEERARAEAAIVAAGESAVQVEAAFDRAHEHEAVGQIYSALANAKPAELSRVRGAGSVSSLRSHTDFTVTHWNQVALAALRPHLPRPAIEQAIRAYIRANDVKPGSTALKGVHFFERKEAQSR